MRFIFAAIFGIVILAVHPSYGQQCPGLRRHADRCEAGGDEDTEYECIANENGLQSIMDCVSIEGFAEKQFCRDAADGKKGTPEHYRQHESDMPVDETDIYITPRDTLLLMSINQCIQCGLTGVLNACPMNDPNFLQCLCEYHVTDEHLRCLSKCFKPESKPPTCDEDSVYSSTHRKRHAAHITTRDGWVNGESTEWIEEDGLKFRIFYTGVFEMVDRDEIPRTSPFHLPYFEELLTEETVARCYISPVSEAIYCFRLYVGGIDAVPPQPTLGHFTQTNRISGQTKTLSDAYKTQTSASFERIEVPTQKPEEKKDEGQKEKEKDKNGVSCFQDKLSLTLILSALMLVGFVVA